MLQFLGVLLAAGAVPSASPAACRAAVAEARALLLQVEADPGSFDDVEETLASLRAATGAPCPEGARTAPPPQAPPATRAAAPPKTAEEILAEAQSILRASSRGAEILARLKTLGVGFRFEPRLPPEVLAAYETTAKEIWFPSITGRAPAELAVVLAHEGHHALQMLQGGYQASIEAEIDATFEHHVVLDELLRAGAVSERDLGDQRLEHRAFRRAVRTGRLDGFELSVAERYREMRSVLLRRLRNRVGPRWGWLAVGAAEFYDADALRAFETLEEQWRLVNWERWSPLARAREAEARRKRWRRRWAEDNRSRF